MYLTVCKFNLFMLFLVKSFIWIFFTVVFLLIFMHRAVKMIS